MRKQLGDCPYEGVCACRAIDLPRRTEKCKSMAAQWCEGERRKAPQKQKGIP